VKTTTTTSTTTTTPGPLSCGEHSITTGQSYTIESPNYPDKYGESDSCKWELTCDESSGTIAISCDSFKTEEDTKCKKADYLKVTDSSGTLDYYCGKTGPDLTSTDNYLELKFGTDDDDTVKKGFSCTVVCSTSSRMINYDSNSLNRIISNIRSMLKPATSVDLYEKTAVEPATSPAARWRNKNSRY